MEEAFWQFVLAPVFRDVKYREHFFKFKVANLYAKIDVIKYGYVAIVIGYLILSNNYISAV